MGSNSEKSAQKETKKKKKLSALAPIAKPLAVKKLSKRALKLVRRAAEHKRGVKEVVKTTRRGNEGVCKIAENISPIDVITRVPILHEESSIPSIYVSSKENRVGPIAVADPARRDLAAANAHHEQLQPRCGMIQPSIPCDPVIDNLILATAANYPCTRMTYPVISTYTPCFASTMFYVSRMDLHMASTKEWTDNCMGWVPPYSQIYISILLYIQTIRAMDAAGAIMPGSEFASLLPDFCKQFGLENLWIPGPLVSAFKNLTSFYPSATGTFGNVTPSIPSSPGWSQESRFSIAAPRHKHLPNISYFFSRLHSICSAATRNNNEIGFISDVDGPHSLAHVFSRPCVNTRQERAVVSSPGASLFYSGSLQLWQDAAVYIINMGIPQTLDVDNDVFEDTWRSFLWFNTPSNWFGPVVSMMNMYCRFWRGSCPLSECSPGSSAAGAVKCFSSPGSTIFRSPDWIEGSGNYTSFVQGNSNQMGHYRMRFFMDLTFRASTTIEDIPDEDVYAALTYQLNLCRNDLNFKELCCGPFWDAYPDTLARSGIQVYHGVWSSISRDYHSDTRLVSPTDFSQPS